MKRITVLLGIFFCASFLTTAQVRSQERQIGKVVDTAYIWPDSLKGKDINIHGIAVDDSSWIFVATVGNGFRDGLVWRSKNNGKTWEHLTNGLQDVFFAGTLSIFLTKQQTLLVGALNGIWRSTDKGNSWENALYGNTYGYDAWCFIQAKDGTIFSGGSQIRKSTDDGKTWTIVPNLPTSFWPIGWFTMDVSGNLYATSNGVLKSTDNGSTWNWANEGLIQDPNQTQATVNQITVDPLTGSLFIYTSRYKSSRMFRSDDEGVHWIPINDGFIGTYSSIFELASSSRYGVFAGLDDGTGIFSSIDGGNKWQYMALEHRAVPVMVVICFAWEGEDTLLVGTGDGLYRVVLSTATGVSRETSGIPKNFSLSQNYPNPFNPATSIQYMVSCISHVTLTVYNTLGQEVATLVNEEKPAGSYSVTFDASNLPSGVYFYRLQAGNFTETKKIILLR